MGAAVTKPLLKMLSVHVPFLREAVRPQRAESGTRFDAAESGAVQVSIGFIQTPFVLWPLKHKMQTADILVWEQGLGGWEILDQVKALRSAPCKI